MNAVGYIRVSTEEQRDHGFSLLAQRRQIQAYCTAKGWDLVKVYADEGLSGKDLNNRPALPQLLATMGDDPEVVLVTRLDRLSRNTRQLLALVEDHFTQNGVRLVSINEGIDPTTPAGEFVLTILAGLAQMERKQIADRVREGMAEAKRQGKHVGRPPFGYKIGGEGTLVPDPTQQFLLRRARHLAREFGYAAAAQELGWPACTLWWRVKQAERRKERQG